MKTEIASLLGITFTLRLGRGFKTDVEKLADAIRQSLNLKSGDRMVALALARQLNMTVKEPSDITAIPESNLHELTINGKDRWSAVLLKADPPHKHLIINNPTHSIFRRESNIFHELSHELCGHEPDDLEFVGGLPIRRFSEEKETQAETLAYSLHLPRHCLFWAAWQGMSREQIGERFCASNELVRMRINSTGIERVLKRKIM